MQLSKKPKSTRKQRIIQFNQQSTFHGTNMEPRLPKCSCAFRVPNPSTGDDLKLTFALIYSSRSSSNSKVLVYSRQKDMYLIPTTNTQDLRLPEEEVPVFALNKSHVVCRAVAKTFAGYMQISRKGMEQLRSVSVSSVFFPMKITSSQVYRSRGKSPASGLK